MPVWKRVDDGLLQDRIRIHFCHGFYLIVVAQIQSSIQKKNYHQTFFKKKIIIGPFDPIALWCELGRRTMWLQQFPVSAAAAPASSNAFTPQQQ